MFKVPFDEFVDLLVNAGPSRFRCRVLHPDRRELVDVQAPYLVVSVPLCLYASNLNNLSHSLGCESAERILRNVTLSQLVAYVIQSEGLQHGDIVLLRMFVRSE